MKEEIVYINLDDIIPNRFQPRETFDEVALTELSQSIKTHGVIQPILVRRVGNKYEIIAGERRYKASILAGLNQIPAIIRELDDKEASKVALLENLQREDLTSIEEARTYQTILSLDNITQQELANNLGKSQSAISNKLRLLNLPIEVQDALLKSMISERHARSLLNVPSKEHQLEFLDLIIKHKMPVKELDDAIADRYSTKSSVPENILASFNEEIRSKTVLPTKEGNVAIGSGLLAGDTGGILSTISKEESVLDYDIFNISVDESALNKPKAIEKLDEAVNALTEQLPVNNQAKPEEERIELTENQNLKDAYEEEKRESYYEEFNKPITNIEDIKIKTDVAIQPKPIEEMSLPSKPNPQIELLMKSREFKRALSNYDRITSFLKSNGIQVEEKRETFEDRLELTFIFKK